AAPVRSVSTAGCRTRRTRRRLRRNRRTRSSPGRPKRRSHPVRSSWATTERPFLTAGLTLARAAIADMAEEAKYTDIHGQPISLDCQDHSPFCREFTVISPKVSLRKVMVYTCSVWLVAYAVFFVTENTTVLSSAIMVTLAGMILHIHFVKVDQETLLIIGSLGVQLSSSYASGRESTTFIEMNKIKDIVINEAIYMHTIIYYLCILIKDSSEPNGVASVVPLFQRERVQLISVFIEFKAETQLSGSRVQKLSGDNCTDPMRYRLLFSRLVELFLAIVSLKTKLNILMPGYVLIDEDTAEIVTVKGNKKPVTDLKFAFKLLFFEQMGDQVLGGRNCRSS
ncbi:hypothetical protein NFI96_030530, partial [Prochilodus magdalenae]